MYIVFVVFKNSSYIRYISRNALEYINQKHYFIILSSKYLLRTEDYLLFFLLFTTAKREDRGHQVAREFGKKKKRKSILAVIRIGWRVGGRSSHTTAETICKISPAWSFQYRILMYLYIEHVLLRNFWTYQHNDSGKNKKLLRWGRIKRRININFISQWYIFYPAVHLSTFIMIKIMKNNSLY